MRLFNFGTIGILVLGACTDASTPTGPSGNAALGISSFQINETATSVEVLGLDANNAVVGRISLQIGPFHMNAENSDDGIARDVDGRNIVMDYESSELTHQSEGYLPLDLPPIAMASYGQLNAFLRDPHVTVALDSWDVHFQGALTEIGVGTETAYSYSGGPYCGAYAESNYASCGTNFTFPCTTQAYQQPSGHSVNQCAGNTLGPAATASNYWGTGYTGAGTDGWITSLAEFCQNAAGVKVANIKSCCTAAGCNTGCGAGGSAGCAVCYGQLQNLTTTEAYCFGNGTGSCTFWGGGTSPPSTGCAGGGAGTASMLYYAQ